MSVFIVSKAHIDLLVDLAMRGPRDVDHSENWDGTRMDLDQLGRMLWEENLRGVLAQYPRMEDDEPARTAIANYKFATPPYRLNVVEAIKAVHCLQYQSAGIGNYDDTPAGSWASEMLYVLAGHIPGYEEALWHWSEEAVEQKSIACAGRSIYL